MTKRWRLAVESILLFLGFSVLYWAMFGEYTVTWVVAAAAVSGLYAACGGRG